MSARSDLFNHQAEQGGVPGDESTIQFSSPAMVHFGDPGGEFRAAREGCVVVELADRMQIEIAGSDAVSFLHKFCTNDIQRLKPGEGCEAFITNVKGRILSHVFVYVTDNGVWLDSVAGNESDLLAHFDRYLFREQVELRGHTDAFGEFYLAGANSESLLAHLGISVSGWPPLRHALGTLHDIAVAVRRYDFWDRPGYLVSTARDKYLSVWEQLTAAGAQPMGGQAFHALRIESGFPLYGIDLSEDNLAQEACRDSRAISFTKGCYLGQEPIARIDALGHINRQLTRLSVSTTDVVKCPAVITSSDATRVGTLTSLVRCPAEPKSVGLGMLKRGYATPGTELNVHAGDAQFPMSIEGSAQS
jgi:folate-binding protein YgfZ